MITTPAIESLADNYSQLTEAHNQRLVRAVKAGDNRALDKLVRHSAKLIFKAMGSLTYPPSLADDLYQEGQIALTKAAQSYRVDLGASWSTHAYRCARRRMVAALVTSKYLQVLAINPHETVIALMPADQSEPDEHLVLICDRLRIHQHLCVLGQREREVITAYFGLDANQRGLRDLGQRYGVTPRRIGYIRDRGLRRLHESMTAPDDARAAC